MPLFFLVVSFSVIGTERGDIIAVEFHSEDLELIGDLRRYLIDANRIVVCCFHGLNPFPQPAFDANIPGERILVRAVFELDFVAGYFEYWQDRDEINEDMVAYLAKEYDIGWTTEALRNVVSRLEAVEHEGNRISTRKEDPDLEVKWDNTASGDKVVGTIRVTPAGEQMKREDETDEEETPNRGFQ